MKKLITFFVVLTMTIPMMAIGRGDGSTKANAIDFEWNGGNVHPGGTLWYRVDLAPLYEEENPSLSLYMTNPSRSVSVDVSMTATVAGEQEAKDYTIAAHQYKSYTANAAMLVRMKQREIYLTLTSTGEVRLSAKVFESSDLDETCKDAKALYWNTEATQTKGYAAWWKVDLTTVKNAVKKDARISITNIGTGAVDIKAGQSLDCPSSGLTKRNFTLAAGETMYDTIPQSMITGVQPDVLYFSIENLAQPVKMKVELIDQPEEPVIPATMALEPLHVTDTTVISAGTHLFWITKAEMNGVNKYEPEFTYRNEGAAAANVSVKMAFHLPAFGTSNTDYALASGEEEIVVYKKNMLEGLGEDVDTIYLLTTVDQPINFYGRYKHVREGKACKTNIDFNWATGHRQEARSTQWYAIDVADARDQFQDIVVYLQNEGNENAKVKASVAFSCPYIDLQEVTRTIAPHSSPVSRTLLFSSYAMMSDTVWIGLETSQDIRFWATTQDAETKADPDTACLHAFPFNWEEGVRQNAGDTVWYLINMEEVREQAAKFPTVFVQNMSSSEPAKITAELSVECPDEIENEKRSLTIAANSSYSKTLSRNLFENIVQDEIYLRVVSTQEIALQIRLTEETEGSSCTSAIPFNWVSGNTQAADANLWYAIDLRDVMKTSDDVRVKIENRDNKSSKGVAQLIFSCPMEEAPSVQSFSLKARGTRSITLQNSTFETLDDSIVYINLQGTTSLHIEATRIPQTKPFDTIYAEGITLIPLQWDSLYTQSVDTAWYIISKEEIDKVLNMEEKVKPVGHLINIGTKANTIKAEAAFAFPITKKMISKSKTLKAGQHYSDTIPAGTFDQILKKDSVIIRITRPIGAGDFQFRAELVGAYGGNSRFEAYPIVMDKEYTQSPNTEMWYKVNTADLKKDPNLYNKILRVVGKNAGKGETDVTVSLYEGLLSETELIEYYTGKTGKRTLKKGQQKEHNIPAQAVYALGDVEIYAKVRTSDSLYFSTKIVGEYAPQAVDPAQKKATLVVPNVDYVVPGDNKEHWYQVCAPYIRNNYQYYDINPDYLINPDSVGELHKYVCAAYLSYELDGTATIEATATLQDEMNCKMPVRKRTINKKGGHHKGTKPMDELINKAIKKAGQSIDVSSFEPTFVDSLLRRYVTDDSITGYVRIKTDKDLKVRLNMPQITGDQCINPMSFDWEHGNVNPAGNSTWYHVKLTNKINDSIIPFIPDTCDLRLHVDNWGNDSTKTIADIYFDCNKPKTKGGKYTIAAGEGDSIDVDRDFLEQLGWADMIIDYHSDSTTHIWAELISNKPRECDYDTIVRYVCYGTEFQDTLKPENSIASVQYSVTWNDTIPWKDGVVMRDSVTTFQIHPLVAPEVLTATEIKALGAAPLMVQGMQLYVDSSNIKLTEYYKNLANAVDTIINIDTVYWAKPVYNTGVLDNKKEAPLDLTSYYEKTDLVDTLLLVIAGGECGDTLRQEIVFPLDAYKYIATADTVCPSKIDENPFVKTVLVTDTLGLTRYVDTVTTYTPLVQPHLYTGDELVNKPVVSNGNPINTYGTIESLKEQFENDITDTTMVVTTGKWQVLNGTEWQDLDMSYIVPMTATSVSLKYIVTTECGDNLTSENIDYTLTPSPECEDPMEEVAETTITICAGDSIIWPGHDKLGYLKEQNTYLDTLYYTGTTCDSLYCKLNLVVRTATEAPDTTITICEGDSIIWPGHDKLGYLKEQNTYLDTLPYAGTTCDSLYCKLNLIVLAATDAEPEMDTICVGDSYIWAGHEYLGDLSALNDTVYYDALPYAAMGCDSIRYELRLKVRKAAEADVDTIIICAGDTAIWSGHEKLGKLTEAGTYYDTLHYAGTTCDSLYCQLKLNVLTVEEKEVENAAICAGDSYYTWEGHDQDKFGALTEEGTYHDTLHYASGCDSVRYTLNLRRLSPAANAEPEKDTICDGDVYTWVGHEKLGLLAPMHDTTYFDTLKYDANNTCDSLYCQLTLKVLIAKDAPSSPESATICAGDTYIWPGHEHLGELTAAGPYYDSKKYAGTNCDSIRYTLNLTVRTATSVNDPAVICFGESYTWPGHEKLGKLTEAGTYYDTAYYAGTTCDSVHYTLDLVVRTATEVEPETHIMCAGDSYSWSGHDAFSGLTEAGTYYDTLFYAGTTCDSAYCQLNLIVHKATDVEESMVICDGESYTWPGHESLGDLTVAGKYYDTLHYASGCDSMRYELDLKVQTVTHAIPEDSTVCNLCMWHNTRYIENGTYYDTIRTAEGCDSIIYQLNLVINVPYQINLSIVSRYGDRLLMINRNQINDIGNEWNLDVENDTALVSWYYYADVPENAKFLNYGYYHTENNQVLKAGYYYAKIDIPGVGGNCGAKGETEHYHVKGASPAPALVPTLARPGEDIRVINLDPEEETCIRLYGSDGSLQRVYTVSGEEFFIIKAADVTGFYMVELSSENLKTTLRYIVK